MRDALDRLLRDATLVTLALGIALGWALFQVAEGISTAITTLLTEYPDSGALSGVAEGGPLTWEINGRLLTLWPLAAGLIELAVVLAVAAFVRARRRDIANPS